MGIYNNEQQLGVTRQEKNDTLRNTFRVQLDNIENYACVFSQTCKLGIMWDLHKLEVSFRL